MKNSVNFSLIFPPSEGSERVSVISICASQQLISTSILFVHFAFENRIAHMSIGSLTYPLLFLRSALTGGGSHVSTSAVSPKPPPATGISQISFVVTDLEAAVTWYADVLAAERVGERDGYDAFGRRTTVTMSLPVLGGGSLELRLVRDCSVRTRRC